MGTMKYAFFVGLLVFLMWCIMILERFGAASFKETPPAIHSGSGNRSWFPLTLNFSKFMKKENNPLKKILYWTNVFGNQNYIVQGQKPFLDSHCVSSNCYITTNKADAHQSLAIIFHMRDVGSGTVYPNPRLPQQNWVFWLMESPEYLSLDLKQYHGVFNLTMTYRLDSDIPQTYGTAFPSTSNNSSYMYELKLKGKPFNEKESVAWFVSNCHTPSKREEFVNELKKYIQVDIYGHCGTKTCSRSIEEECWDMLEKNYKYYLSFENSLCKDYVTEKPYRILKHMLIPIVFGSADYEKFLPPGSFINAMEYDSPRQLAEYLADLGKNETRYMEYFRWKSKFSIGESTPLCKLCEYINQPRQYHVYDDIHQWWKVDGKCDHELIGKMKRVWS